MTDIIRGLTRKGRRALKNDRVQGMHLLILEISARTENIEVDHATDLAVQLLARYGCPEDAVAALRSGEVKLQKAS